MGLFDSYFDPQHFGGGGGLLGRLLSLQQQGQYQSAQDFDQTPSDGSLSAQNLTSQYPALRPILGDHRAMIAIINTEVGRTLIAQALARQQKSGNTGDVFLAGHDRPVVSGVSPDPIRSGSQYAQAAMGLCATGPGGCAAGRQAAKHANRQER
jgi:hypothetical protein